MRPVDPRLLRHARASRPLLAATLVVAAATAGLLVVQATVLAHVVTRVFLGGDGLPAVRADLLVLLGAFAGRAVLAWASDVAAQRAAARAKSQLRTRALRHLLALGPDALAGARTGDVVATVTRGIDALDGYFGGYLPQLAIALVVPPVVLAWSVPVDRTSAIVLAVTLPLVPLFMILIGMAAEARTNRQWDALHRLSAHFLDVLEGLPTLRLANRAGAQTATIRAVTDELRLATMGTLRIAFLSALVLELLAMLGVATVAVFIGIRLAGGSLALEPALAVLLLAPEAYLPLRRVGAQFHASREGMEAANRLFAILDRQLPAPGTRPAPDLARVPLVLTDVTVRHDEREVAALDHVSLRIDPGEHVAVVGASGAGKSTLAAVLLGLQPPSSGVVTGGGVPIADLDPATWRRQVAWVPQRVALVRGTVADNLRLGSPDADPAALRRVAAQVHLGEWVDGLPDGLATPIGPGARPISAGQRRRIGIARALLRGASLLVLDEPTADLDAASETAVRATLASLAGRATVVVFTHRLALADDAPRVVVLEHGLLVADGAPAGLRGGAGPYARLHAAMETV